MKVTMKMADDYKKWYLGQGHTMASMLEYYNNIKRFVKSEGIVDQKHVDRFRETCMRTTSSGALKSFFKFLIRKHNAPDDILNIRFDRNKQTKKYPKSITYQEVEIIVNNMPTLKYKILTIFIFELGLRIGEALKVKWDDFNWLEWISNKEDYGKVVLRNTKRGKFRTMPVKPQLMSLIYGVGKKNSMGVPIGTVVFDFGIEDYINNKERTNEENLYYYLNKAGTFYRKVLYSVSRQHLGKKVSPHVLRHSKAQQLMDNGMPIESLKNFMGHEEISTTEIYAQASPTKVKKDLKSFDIFKQT